MAFNNSQQWHPPPFILHLWRQQYIIQTQLIHNTPISPFPVPVPPPTPNPTQHWATPWHLKQHTYGSRKRRSGSPSTDPGPKVPAKGGGARPNRQHPPTHINTYRPHPELTDWPGAPRHSDVTVTSHVGTVYLTHLSSEWRYALWV